MKQFLSKIFAVFLIATITIFITGCQNKTDEITIEVEIKDSDLYSVLPEIDWHESFYNLHYVNNYRMAVSKRDYLRDEWGVYNTITTAVYMYDIEKGTASEIDIQIPETGFVLSFIEIQDDLYFYIIAVQNDSGQEDTFYYLDSGDNSNVIFQSSNETMYTPSVVVDGDDIYFVVSDTRSKDVLISRGYTMYLDLKIYKLTQDLNIETVFEAPGDLYAFFFDYSNPLCFLAVNEYDELTFYVYEDETLKEYVPNYYYDGIAAFGGKVYGIHDNWGEDNRELYWYDIRNDNKVPMETRAEDHMSLGNYEIVIDNYGTAILKSNNGEIVSYDIQEGLEDALYAVKIDDHSAFIACRYQGLKIIYLS